MANNTIYPYGIGGQMPSGIPLVNDLTTGGADKALSAEQGKVIGQMIGVTDIDITDAFSSSLPEGNLKTIPANIRVGVTYKIAWSGATANSSVLSVSFGSESSTSQTTSLNQTTLTTESGYITVLSEVNATHLRIVSRSPVVSSVTLSHTEQATGVLDNLKNSMYDALPMLELAWVNNSAISASNGTVASNTNCICSRTFLPLSKYGSDLVLRFLSKTENKYNFALAFYTSASESSFLGRTSFATNTEIDYSATYASANYVRISLVYKDPTNTTVLSAGIADEFELWNLSLLSPSSLQKVASMANETVRVSLERSEVIHSKITTGIYAGQGFCKCGEYWLSGQSSGTSFDSGSSSNAYIFIYNSSFTQVGQITHNLGHFSCLSYDAVSDSFISSNGNANEYPRLDILLNATDHITAAINSQTSQYLYGASDVISIPLHTSSKDLLANGDAGVWCFGGNNRYVYISVRDSVSKVRKFYKGILGVGTANFSSTGWGTYISGKTDSQYNGTLKILEFYDGESINSAQGIDYLNGKLILASGSTSLDINVVSVSGGKYQIDARYRISNLAADCSAVSSEPEDLTVADESVYLNSTIGTFKFKI